MVKGLKIDDELETGNLDKSGDELETIDLVRMFDLEMLNQLKAKRRKGQRKRCQYRDNKGADKGLMNRQANRKGRYARI